MQRDVIDLRDFYTSRLGMQARRALRLAVRHFWPDTRGLRVVGVGYTPPLLRHFLDEAERLVTLMPAAQGVVRWPTEAPNNAVLTAEDSWPLADASGDRVLLLHALEYSLNPAALLQEAWRVLAGNGRLLLVVPNRRGLWARFDHTPFGHGQPYSAGQMLRLLRECGFTPHDNKGALYFPPLRSPLLYSIAPAAEKIGSRWFTGFAGVRLIEASKQIFAVRPQPTARLAWRIAPAVGGI